MSKRVRLTQDQYDELTQSHSWCQRNGFTGMQRYYEEELAFQAKRRALPEGAREYRELDEERAPRSRRD